MPGALQSAMLYLLDRRDLTAEQMHAAVSVIMDGQAGEPMIAALLTALRMKGESVSEIVGAARAMHERATRIPARQSGLLDTCGTGGDGLQTFNISTAAALVAAAAGVPVAKHGNRSFSSTCGSADVLEALGVNLQLSPERVAKCIEEVGIGFCFAPLLHGAMKHAAPVRKALGFRTIFNLLGPLTNPAGAEYQVVGTPHPQTARKLAEALAQLGRTRALVVCGAGGLDEVSLWGETLVYVVERDEVSEQRWTAETFGLQTTRVEELQIASAHESAERIRQVFGGSRGPSRDIVVANAAAALIAANRYANPLEAARAAEKAIDAGEAARTLRRLADFTVAA